jgi:hypothetical protein
VDFFHPLRFTILCPGDRPDFLPRRTATDASRALALVLGSLGNIRTSRSWLFRCGKTRACFSSLDPASIDWPVNELNGDDLRRDLLDVRKATLASVLAKSGPGIRLNEHMECDDGETVFRHACKMGLEGIVSKRKDSSYRSGRSSDWLKMKNPACAAVKRGPSQTLVF